MPRSIGVTEPSLSCPTIEHVKRYTALGFGTDQGKLGNATARCGERAARHAPRPRYAVWFPHVPWA